jgi:uncharacterized protein
MGKVLTWIVIALAAWSIWRLVLISQRRAARSRTDATPAGREPGVDPDDRSPERVAAPETMVQCAVCGVHLPGSEARYAGGRTYCGDAHRDEGVARRADPVRRDDA